MKLDAHQLLFIYTRNGEIQCLNRSECHYMHESLGVNGWKHTATINPARWIESMANGGTDPSDMLDELLFTDKSK